jgi:hypothetical protein
MTQGKSPFADRNRLIAHPREMRRVVVESPFAGDVDENIKYARACIRDCLLRGESPVASHLLLTQDGVLNDRDPIERAVGINAGHAWMHGADAVVVYQDRGISAGMQAGINVAQFHKMTIEYRSLFIGYGAIVEIGDQNVRAGKAEHTG